MKFSEFEGIRVKLGQKGKKEFWKVIDEFGGVKQFSDAFDISPSKMYNWKSKDSYLPIELVKRVFGNEGSNYVKEYKGSGRSNPVKNPVFPIPENNELLTRIDSSVTVSSNGIPLYQASGEGLVQRFNDLLQELGDVPVKIYDREVFELRYPKYLHEILMKISYEENLEALIDENGSIENREITLNDRSIDPKDIGNLYHRDKRLKLALIREDNKEIMKMMSEEKEKVRKALKQA